MVGIGEKLRKSREAQELSLELISRKTNLKKDFILALEDEDFSQLPTMIHAKGFLKTYVQFLNLNADDILKSFDDLVEQSFRTELASKIRLSSEARPKLTWIDVRNEFFQYLSYSQDKIKFFIVGTIVLIVAYYGLSWGYQTARPFVTSWGGWVSSLWTSSKNAEPSEQANVSEVVDQEVPQTQPVLEQLLLQVDVKKSVWMSLTADGNVLYEGVMQKGMNEIWKAEDEIVIRIGDAKGVDFLLNGQAIEELEEMEQKVSRIRITPKGIEFR